VLPAQVLILPLKEEYTFRIVLEGLFLDHTNHQQDFFQNDPKLQQFLPLQAFVPYLLAIRIEFVGK
jgi:hypothetical protein